MPRYFEICRDFLNSDIRLPKRSSENAAGYDMEAGEEVLVPSVWKYLLVHFVLRQPIKPTVIHTHIKAKLGDKEFLAVYNRSSNPLKYGLVTANTVSIIDSDYYSNPHNDGDIGMVFYNIFPWDITVKKGQKIGTGIFQSFLTADSSPNHHD